MTPDGPERTVCVHGLGYVGLPTAAMLAHDGYEVLGVDVDERTVERLRAGDPGDVEADLAAFVREALDGPLRVSTDPEPAAFHVVCVPTPLVDGGEPRADLSMVGAAGATVAPAASTIERSAPAAFGSSPSASGVGTQTT